MVPGDALDEFNAVPMEIARGSDVREGSPSMDILMMARAMGAARAELSRQAANGQDAPTIAFDGWPTEVVLDGPVDIEALVKAVLAGIATGS